MKRLRGVRYLRLGLRKGTLSFDLRYLLNYIRYKKLSIESNSTALIILRPNLKQLFEKMWEEIGIKDVRGWQFLTIDAAETLCMVCIPSEKHIFRKKYLGSRPFKKYFIRV